MVSKRVFFSFVFSLLTTSMGLSSSNPSEKGLDQPSRNLGNLAILPDEVISENLFPHLTCAELSRVECVSKYVTFIHLTEPVWRSLLCRDYFFTPETVKGYLQWEKWERWFETHDFQPSYKYLYQRCMRDRIPDTSNGSRELIKCAEFGLNESHLK